MLISADALCITNVCGLIAWLMTSLQYSSIQLCVRRERLCYNARDLILEFSVTLLPALSTQEGSGFFCSDICSVAECFCLATALAYFLRELWLCAPQACSSVPPPATSLCAHLNLLSLWFPSPQFMYYLSVHYLALFRPFPSFTRDCVCSLF